MDLGGDIREFVVNSLPHDPKYTSELRAKTPQELLIIYGNWRSRLVSMGPRQTHCSQALDVNPLSNDPRYKSGLDAIISRLEAGHDVTANLSRGIRHGYRPPTNAGKGDRQDLDLLLNDWGVHHLHLSTVVEADGFVKRTGPLLFAAFKPDHAFLIDIIEHGGWTRDHVIQTMVAEWPNEDLVWELKGIIPSAKRTSESDRKALRNAHVNSFFEKDGKAYMPAGGLTTAGTSTRNTRSVQGLLRTLKWFEQQLDNDPDYLKKAGAQNGITLPANPDLHFQFFPAGGYGVIETQTGLRFVLG